LSDMSNIAKWLSVFNATSGKLPMPDNKINITASWIAIWYQWYAWASVLNMIKVSNWWKDPLDTNTFYTYSANSAQDKFQILWFLEDWSNTVLTMSPGFLSKPGLEWASADSISYSWRYIVTKWDQLWILLQSSTMVPAQVNLSPIDLVSSTGSFQIQFSNKDYWAGSWTVLFSNAYLRNTDLIRNKDLAKLDTSLVWYWDMETTALSWSLIVMKDLSMYKNNWSCTYLWTAFNCWDSNYAMKSEKIWTANWLTFSWNNLYLEIPNSNSIWANLTKMTTYIKFNVSNEGWYIRLMYKWWWNDKFIHRIEHYTDSDRFMSHYQNQNCNSTTGINCWEYEFVKVDYNNPNIFATAYDWINITQAWNWTLYKSIINPAKNWDLYNNNGNLIIWAINDWNYWPDRKIFIDEVRIYNRPLSDNELMILNGINR
jgi:hypothetical protein